MNFPGTLVRKLGMAKSLSVALALLPLVGSPVMGGTLSEDLARALEIDAEYLSLSGRRSAAAARGATIDTFLSGSPSIGSSAMGNRFGTGDGREFEIEMSAPVWLPGQRGAVRQSIDAEVDGIGGLALRRRMEVLGTLRDALWDFVGAEREAALARERLGTARDIERDVRRRAQLGDLARGDVLLAENETLQAEGESVRLESEVAAARLAYATMTGGAEPIGYVEPLLDPAASDQHPLLRAALSQIEAARARRREIETLNRDNPELGVFGKSISDASGTSQAMGGRVRIPFATDARNLPRLANADAELVRATAEGEKHRREIEAGIRRSLQSLKAVEQELGLANRRLSVAAEQYALARRAFDAGEIGFMDFLRMRQIYLEAGRSQAMSDVSFARARSRLNHAYGLGP